MTETSRMRPALVRVCAWCVALTVGLGAVGGTVYWLSARRFVAEDAHALDGIVRAPVDEPVVFRNVALWDGRGGPLQHGRSVVVRDGHIAQVVDAAVPLPGCRWPSSTSASAHRSMT